MAPAPQLPDVGGEPGPGTAHRQPVLAASSAAQPVVGGGGPPGDSAVVVFTHKWKLSCSRAQLTAARIRLVGAPNELSDHGGTAQSGEPPDRTPLHGPARPAGRGPALPEAAEPGPQRRPRGPAGQREQQPDPEVDRDQRARAGCAGPARRGCGPPSGGRPRAGTGRSSGGAAPCPRGSRSSSRRRAPARPGRSPRGRRRTRRAALPTSAKTSGAHGVGAAEEGGHAGGAHRVGGAQPRDVAALGDAGVRVGDAEADDAELAGRPRRPGGTARRCRCSAAGRRRRGRAARRRRGRAGPNASMPTLRPPGMPRFSGSSTVRTPSGTSGTGAPLPTTTTSTAVAVLLGHRVEQGAQLGGAVAHGDDDRADLQRAALAGALTCSLLEARMDTRCSRVCRSAMPASTATPEAGEEQVAADLVDDRQRPGSAGTPRCRGPAGGTSARRRPGGPAPCRRSAARRPRP